MLKDYKIEKKEIKLYFELKNKGKFRFKKLSDENSPYSQTLNKKSISDKGGWYLEWMISYYLDNCEQIKENNVLDKTLITVKGKNICPYELPVLYKKALEHNLMDKKRVEKLLEWIKEAKETLEDSFSAITKMKEDVKLNGLNFTFLEVSLPLLRYNNSDDSWVDLFLQNRQKAYGFQPFVFLCIPHDAFEYKTKECGIWTIHLDTLEILFKVFASASERHREDISTVISEYVLK